MIGFRWSRPHLEAQFEVGVSFFFENSTGWGRWVLLLLLLLWWTCCLGGIFWTGMNFVCETNYEQQIIFSIVWTKARSSDQELCQMLLSLVEKEGHCNPGRWVSTQRLHTRHGGSFTLSQVSVCTKTLKKSRAFFLWVCVKAEDDRRTGEYEKRFRNPKNLIVALDFLGISYEAAMKLTWFFGLSLAFY